MKRRSMGECDYWGDPAPQLAAGVNVNEDATTGKL